MERIPGDESLTLTLTLPQLFEALGWKFCLWSSLQVERHKEEIFFIFFSFKLSFHGMMRVNPAVAGGEYNEKRFGCQARRRMVQARSEWRWFVRDNAWGVARGMNPRPWRDATVVCFHNYMNPLKGGSPFVAEPIT